MSPPPHVTRTLLLITHTLASPEFDTTRSDRHRGRCDLVQQSFDARARPYYAA